MSALCTPLGPLYVGKAQTILILFPHFISFLVHRGLSSFAATPLDGSTYGAGGGGGGAGQAGDDAIPGFTDLRTYYPTIEACAGAGGNGALSQLLNQYFGGGGGGGGMQGVGGLGGLGGAGDGGSDSLYTLWSTNPTPPLFCEAKCPGTGSSLMNTAKYQCTGGGGGHGQDIQNDGATPGGEKAGDGGSGYVFIRYYKKAT